MKDQLVSFACGSLALVWICFVGPWLARLCGVPVRAAFWTMNRQNPPMTRLQFVWAFGVLVCGIGIFIFNFGPNIAKWVLDKRSSGSTFGVVFALAISVFMGVVIGFWCAPTQVGESPITQLDLSRRK